jgi:hypothetical protein
MKLLESVTSKIVAGVMGLGVVVGGITWWQTPPATRDAILTSLGHFLAWCGVVLVGPWAGVLLVGWVAKKDTNLAGGLLVGGMTLAEAVLLAWLDGWHIGGAAAWVFFLMCVLVAGAYNLLICDWLAERVS